MKMNENMTILFWRINKMGRFTLAYLFILLSTLASANANLITLVKKGESKYSIVLAAGANANEQRAASLLQ